MTDIAPNQFQQQIIASGLLTKDQLAAAVEDSNNKSIDLIAYLYKQQRVDETLFTSLIAHEYSFGILNWQEFMPTQIPKEAIDHKLVVESGVLPVELKPNGILKVAISHPNQTRVVDQLRRKGGYRAEIVMAEPSRITQIINQYFTDTDHIGLSSEDVFDRLSIDDDDDNADSATTEIDDENTKIIIAFVDQILRDAISSKASDIHFEQLETQYRVRFRVDGVMRQIRLMPKNMANRLTNRLKIMAKLDLSEKRNPQDGKFRYKYNDKRSIDFRVSTLPTVHGEKIVLRVLDGSSALLGIEALGFSNNQKALFLEALDKPQGMILITGPTGSGKTVSLYTGLGILNTIDRNISTAEDPVEINLPGVSQVSINPKAGLTFPKILKAFLRQDPDVIMVGEIRDLETAEIGIQAAQTGHLVLSTLHTNSASETLTRLRNMGVPSFNISSSVNLVIAQRLVRRLCLICKIPVEITDELRQRLISYGMEQQSANDPELKLFSAVGCPRCNLGFLGRVGIYEVVKVTPEISDMILKEKSAPEIEQIARSQGYPSLRYSGFQQAIMGVTSVQEILKATNE